MAALVAAVEDGRLPLARLEEAAARVRALAAWAHPTAEGAPSRDIGLDAARRALYVRGRPAAGPAPFVVELVPQANIAAGDLAYGLAELWPGADGIRLTSADDAGDVARRADGRPVVLVVRDAARHAWQRELVERLPDAIVVETGLPAGRDAAIETYGAGRVNLEAAIEALRPAGSARGPQSRS